MCSLPPLGVPPCGIGIKGYCISKYKGEIAWTSPLKVLGWSGHYCFISGHKEPQFVGVKQWWGIKMPTCMKFCFFFSFYEIWFKEFITAVGYRFLVGKHPSNWLQWKITFPGAGVVGTHSLSQQGRRVMRVSIPPGGRTHWLTAEHPKHFCAQAHNKHSLSSHPVSSVH